MIVSETAFDQNELAGQLFSLRRKAHKAPTALFATIPADVRSAMEVQNLLSEQEAIGSNAWKVAAWCELREDFRHFRVDRMTACQSTASGFTGESNLLREKWRARHELFSVV